MSMDVGGAKGGVKSDINVTPLVDVMLVLLIIMMLVAPMLNEGVSVRSPAARSPAARASSTASRRCVAASSWRIQAAITSRIATRNPASPTPHMIAPASCWSSRGEGGHVRPVVT